jgi:hypothetical protein
MNLQTADYQLQTKIGYFQQFRIEHESDELKTNNTNLDLQN